MFAAGSWRSALVACLVLSAPVLALLDGWTYWQLKRDGIETTGTVTGLTTHHRKASIRYVVRYRFRDESRLWHTGRQSVRSDVYRRLSEGQGISVIYSASNPTANAVSLENLHDSVAFLSMLSLVLALVAACGAWVWHRIHTNPEWQTP